MPYSVPEEARRVFLDGILNNPLVAKNLPLESSQYAEIISFEGSQSPSIPINWRWAESISALKALEAAMLGAMLERKYNVRPRRIVINTDHAQLFFMSPLLSKLDVHGRPFSGTLGRFASKEDTERLGKLFPSFDKYQSLATSYRKSCTNIYKTKDGRFYNIHGSLNPNHTLDSIGLPHDMEVATPEQAVEPYIQRLAEIDSEDMQHRAADIYKQAGTICWTVDEYQSSEHGKANAHVGLFEIKEISDAPETQPPCWWPDVPQTGPKRPLAGLKVVDLTRIIAAPAISRGLAEMGASVMRVTAEHIPDLSSLHCDLNWGKWNCFLDLREEKDRARLRQLISDADVVVQGYRPRVLDKWGFGVNDILKLCENRARGIICVQENCYGWYGPWAERSGWQQISDACCGVSMEFGRAMGNDEPVIPFFPNSDYSTGVSGVVGVLSALLKRADHGGSYVVTTALNYYSQWLVRSCGTYPEDVWEKVWQKNGKPVIRHFHNVHASLPGCMAKLRETSGDSLFRPEFFEVRECTNLGISIQTVKPIVQFPDDEVELKYNVGTRSNGVDAPYWPNDLLAPVVKLEDI